MQAESWQAIADTLGFRSEDEMLKDLYVEQGFSLSQLRSILGFSTFAIRRRLTLLGIEMKKRGGSSNRLGRRRLKHLTNEELTTVPGAILAQRHQVHVSTVYVEQRFRRKEMRDAVRSDSTGAGI